MTIQSVVCITNLEQKGFELLITLAVSNFFIYQVEKYSGNNSMTMEFPFFASSNKTLTIGCSRLPRYLINVANIKKQ
ncbi:MAG: hypothetical protein WCB31_10235 [Nitrososphaeraceae archaeon]